MARMRWSRRQAMQKIDDSLWREFLLHGEGRIEPALNACRAKTLRSLCALHCIWVQLEQKGWIIGRLTRYYRERLKGHAGEFAAYTALTEELGLSPEVPPFMVRDICEEKGRYIPYHLDIAMRDIQTVWDFRHKGAETCAK